MAIEIISTCPICAGTTFQSEFECTDQTVSKEKFQLVKCLSCSFLITNPRPDQNSIDKYYDSPDYISHSSRSSSLQDKIYFKARQYSLTKKRNLIEKYSTRGNILDIGCGTGEFLKQMLQHSWSSTGSEPNAKAQSIAREKGITIFSDISEITEKKFHAITLWHVLEHIHSLNEAIEKIKDLIEPDGTIFIAVPNHKSNDAQHYKEYWAAYDVPRHLWHFDQATMNAFLKKHQLHLVKTVPMKLDSFYVSLLSEAYQNLTEPKLIQMIKAFFRGLLSNIKASSSSEYSSLIYIVKK